MRDGYVDMGWFDEPVDMSTALKKMIVHNDGVWKRNCQKEVAA